jgi:hypothetical protein
MHLIGGVVRRHVHDHDRSALVLQRTITIRRDDL